MPTAPITGIVRITEVHQNIGESPLGSHEWVEIQNLNGSVINLQNWRIGTVDEVDVFVSNPATLQDGECAIIHFTTTGPAGDNDSTGRDNAGYGAVFDFYVADSNVFANTQDQVVLKNSGNAYVDAMVYWDNVANWSSVDPQVLVNASEWDSSGTSAAVNLGSSSTVRMMKRIDANDYNCQTDWTAFTAWGGEGATPGMENTGYMSPIMLITEADPRGLNATVGHPWFELQNVSGSSLSINLNGWITNSLDSDDLTIAGNAVNLADGRMALVHYADGVSENDSTGWSYSTSPGAKLNCFDLYLGDGTGANLYTPQDEIVLYNFIGTDYGVSGPEDAVVYWDGNFPAGGADAGTLGGWGQWTAGTDTAKMVDYGLAAAANGFQRQTSVDTNAKGDWTVMSADSLNPGLQNMGYYQPTKTPVGYKTVTPTPPPTPSPTPTVTPTPTPTPYGYKTPTPIPTSTPTPTAAPNLSVVINEVAWMGTSHSIYDEWIELYNPTTGDINIENWSIYGADTEECLNFASYDGFTTFTVAAEGYATFANDSWVFQSGAVESIWDTTILLSNTGDRLILYDAADCAGDVVDIVDDDDGSWLAGESTPLRKTMERRDPGRYGTDPANWVTWSGVAFATDSGGWDILGSPGAINTGYSLATPTPTRTPKFYKTATPTPTPTLTPVGYKTVTPTPTPVGYKTATPTPVGYKTATPTPTPTPTTTPTPKLTLGDLVDKLPAGEQKHIKIDEHGYYIHIQTTSYFRVYDKRCMNLLKIRPLPVGGVPGGILADSYYIYTASGNWLCRWNNDGTFGESGSSNQGKAINSIYGDGSDYLYAAYADGNTERFDRADFTTSTVLSNAGSNRYDVFVDSYYIYAADGDKQIYVWNESDLSFVTSFSPQSASNWATESAAMTAVHADSYYLFAGNANDNVYEFYLDTFAYKTRKDFATETITALFADPLSRYYYASSEDNNLYVYETDKWDVQTILSDGTDDMLDVCADTEYIFGACSDGYVYIWMAEHTPTPAPTPSPSPIIPTPTPVGYKTPIPTPTPVGYKTVTPTPIPSPTPTAEINTPPPTPTPNGFESPTPTTTPAAYGWVVFNELAWMGTTASYNDEWIELYVNNGSNLDLLGWTISAYDGTPNFTIGSTTSLNTGDYVLLERQSDNTVSDIAADFVYPYPNWLETDGEDLWLKDDGGTVVDHINMADYWWAGDNSTKYTMERVRPDWPSDKQYNWATWNGTTHNGQDAEGVNLTATAKSRNSVWSASAPTPVVSPTPANYLEICFNEIAWMGTDAASGHEWIECKNNSGATINMKGFRIYTKSGNVDFTVLSTVNITAGGYYIFERATDYVVRDVTGYVYSDTGYLSNAGERLVLASNGVIWDDIDYAAGWPAGVADPVIYTMEKLSSAPAADGNNPVNWGNNDGDPIVGRDADDDPINGTAKAGNSIPRRAPQAPATGTLQPELYPKDRYYPAPAPTPGEEVPTPPPAPEEADLVLVESGDYDGDGIADVAIFRPETGLWVIRDLSRFYFGGSDGLPVSGDYDGDGSTDVAVYRLGLWAIKDLSRAYLGTGSDVPVPGDYDGDGRADLAVYRPATGLWVAPRIIRAYFGGENDIPIPGDYDGDGTVDLAVFRPEEGRWTVRGVSRFYLGAAGDIPVPADYGAGGADTAAIFRPAPFDGGPVGGLWVIRGLSRFYFGVAGDIPVPADYTGDEAAEIAIFRPDSGLLIR